MSHRNDWRFTAGLFALTGLFESLAFGHLSAFTPLYLRELHVSASAIPSWTGILSALAFVIGLPLLPFWGVWADRYGRKLIIVRSSIFAAMIYAFSGACVDVWTLAATRLLGGFVFGNTGVMKALQSDITPREKLGGAVAIVSAGSPVGMAIGPFAGGLVVERCGIRTLLYTDAVLTGLVILALILFLKDEPPLHTDSRSGVKDAIRGVTHDSNVRTLFFTVFLLAMGLSLAMPYVPILVQGLYHAPDVAAKIGMVLTGGGIAMAIATPFWGRLGDRLGHLGVLRFCAVAVDGSLAAQALSGSVLGLGISRIAQGIFQGGLGSLAIVLLALYTPRERRSSVLNLSLLPQQFAWFVGPLIGSGVSLVSAAAPFWAGSAAVLAGGLVSLRLPPPIAESEST